MKSCVSLARNQKISGTAATRVNYVYRFGFDRLSRVLDRTRYLSITNRQGQKTKQYVPCGRTRRPYEKVLRPGAEAHRQAENRDSGVASS